MNYLKKARKHRRLKQYEAAELLGMSQQQLSQYETGKKQPGEMQILRFAVAYRMQIVFDGNTNTIILNQDQTVL